MSPAEATTVTVTAESGVPEIPFKLINNHLILEVSVNGSSPFDVGLDTGMPSPGLALYDNGSRTDTLDLDFDPAIKAQVGGVGGDGARLEVRVAMDESIALAGLTIDNTRVILLPSMPEFDSYHDGIIGYSIFERFVVELDYDNFIMRLHAPEHYEVPSDAYVVPLKLHRNLPFATVQITPYGQDPFEAIAVVDLGAAHAISLNTDWSEHVAIPEPSLTAIIGRGLSGPVEGEVGRIATLELAGAKLGDVVATFPVSKHQNPRGVDSQAGNLGSDVLRRFNTTFDYHSGRMILQPNESFNEPFKFDRSGIRLGMGAVLKVEGLIAGSPAEEAGIEINDILTHLNGREVQSKDYGLVRQALAGTGEIRLTIRRGQQVLDKTVTLRKLI